MGEDGNICGADQCLGIEAGVHVMVKNICYLQTLNDSRTPNAGGILKNSSKKIARLRYIFYPLFGISGT